MVQYEAKFTHRTRQGEERKLLAAEPVCFHVWMDKKYGTTDKKVVFITNCIPAIPTDPELQCHRKDIRDENGNYNPQLIVCPPILKGYNYRIGGVDRHDRLVGQQAIPLTSKRGYIKIFFHILESAMFNAWILFKTDKQPQSLWNTAAESRDTFAWFKECVILSLWFLHSTKNYSIHKVGQSRITNTILRQHSTASDTTNERYTNVGRKSSREVLHLQKITAYSLHQL